MHIKKEKRGIEGMGMGWKWGGKEREWKGGGRKSILIKNGSHQICLDKRLAFHLSVLIYLELN